MFGAFALSGTRLTTIIAFLGIAVPVKYVGARSFYKICDTRLVYYYGVSICDPENVKCGIFVTPNEDTKMRKGKGRFINRPTRTGGRLYDKFFIYIPTEVARDGTFPFKEGEEVMISIEDGKLIIEKLKKEGRASQ